MKMCELLEMVVVTYDFLGIGELAASSTRLEQGAFNRVVVGDDEDLDNDDDEGIDAGDPADEDDDEDELEDEDDDDDDDDDETGARDAMLVKSPVILCSAMFSRHLNGS